MPQLYTIITSRWEQFHFKVIAIYLGTLWTHENLPTTNMSHPKWCQALGVTPASFGALLVEHGNLRCHGSWMGPNIWRGPKNPKINTVDDMASRGQLDGLSQPLFHQAQCLLSAQERIWWTYLSVCPWSWVFSVHFSNHVSWYIQLFHSAQRPLETSCDFFWGNPWAAPNWTQAVARPGNVHLTCAFQRRNFSSGQ